MGSLQCPLCCGETFRTPLELATHLETILGNIECGCCSLKFSDFQSLVEHYKTYSRQDNTFVKDLDEESLTWHMDKSSDFDEQVLSKGCIEFLSEAMRIKTEEDLQASIPISANVVDTNENAMYAESVYVKEEGGKVGGNEGDNQGCQEGCPAIKNNYQCSCGMVFESLLEHLMNYHNGEEVVIKGDIKEIENILEKKATDVTKDKVVDVSIKNLQDSTVNVKEEEPEVIICSPNSDEAMESTESLPTTQMTSLQIDQLDGKVEECVDKDGRVYLRKFVRVKKFWSEKDEILASQMKTKVRDYDLIRDVPIGSVSIKSKDEIVTSSQSGQPKRLYQCRECEKTFQTLIHFKYHVCSMKNGSAMTCNMCGHESTSTKDLRAHWRMHQRQRRVAATALWELQAGEGASGNGIPENDGDGVELQCDRCGEMYPKSEELVHVAMHDEEPPHSCQKCDESFDSREKLTRHMKTHREPRVYNCVYCGKAFSDSNAYKLHVRTHTGEKPYECQYCGKKFSRPYERMKHERIHTGERPHVCEICGKTFRVSYCLTLHKRTHSGDRPYTCETCGKRFKAHSAYKHHIQIHSDARNYKCPFCPKAFKTMVHLSGHKKTHTKPFLCTECNRRFASLYSMKSHIESHKTGKNSFRYRCFVCGASYARSFALHAHMLAHEPCDAPEDVAEVLEICGEDQKKEEGDVGLLGECSKNIIKQNEKSENESVEKNDPTAI